MADLVHTVDLPVLGMTCAACVGRVERAVAAVPGVTRADVNLVLSRAHLELDPSATAGAIRAIREAGYEVPDDALESTGASGGERLAALARAEAEETSGLRRDAILAIALTAPLVAIAMTLAGTASVIVQLVLGTIVVLGPGRRYLSGGLAAVRHRSPDMNTLIALGAGAAWLASTVTAIRWLGGERAGMPTLYFEAGAAIVAFVMIGKLLEARARSRLSEAVRGLVALAPAHAHRLVAGIESDVDAAALEAGDAIAVRPGERLPADGTIVEGRSAIDEAMLTGESLPVDKGEGAAVYAGTLNHHGALVVRVARAGADTTLAKIALAVEAAQGGKAPIARIADRVAAHFVPIVLAIGALTFAGWAIGGAGAGVALERMIAVLVIACPCALGLATPAAVAVGTSRGAELGVLFRGGAVLETASHVDVVCFDKTGTLTAGTPSLVAVIGDDAMLGAVASAEQASEHPIARAIVDGAKARGLTLTRPTDAVIEPGAGLRAQVGDAIVRAGTRDYLELAGIVTEAFEAQAGELAAAGRTPTFVAIDDTAVGLVAIADPPRADAARVIAAIRALGAESVMVTGDREGAARWIAGEVGITRIHAGVRPLGKAALVAELRAGGQRVAFVGDGLNDAPALAAADLGIALGSGTDLAAATADITLLRGLGELPTALALARDTLRTIRRNLVAAFVYNAVCIPIAASGLLSPMLSAAAMSLSSVSVLLSSLRLRRWSPSW
jgi:P-type Cu+ transporter